MSAPRLRKGGMLKATEANISPEPDTRPISIVIADGHPVALHTVAAALRAQADMNLVSACRSGTGATRAIRALAPDIAILDIATPKLNVADILSTVVAARSHTKIIFFTEAITEGEALNCITAGVRGIILKSAPLSQLISCVREVFAGRLCFTQRLFNARPKRKEKREWSDEPVLQALTKRQQQIALLVCEGNSNRAIAQRLKLSEGTVKIHLHNIHKKMGIPNRTALAALVLVHREGLRQ